MASILASASQSRRAMLEAAGVVFEVAASGVDEAEVKARVQSEDAEVLAGELSLAKAMAVSTIRPDSLVIGADSIVTAPDGRLLDKPATRADAACQLRLLAGAAHRLTSAAVLVRAGARVWAGSETAILHVRDFSDTFLEAYLAREWEEIRHCVGGYRFEALGAQLFERVEGSHFAILGLPLLPLLEALRAEGELQA